MEKMENCLKKDRLQKTRSGSKRLLFLLLLLLTQLFACGQVVGWPESDDIAPTVKLVAPADKSTDVALNAFISATFSEAMNPETISTSTFTLFKESTQVTGEVAYSGITATFTPTTTLDPEVEYVATITNKVKDLAGNLMTEDFAWTFTTGQVSETVPPQVIATIPLNDATDVVLNAAIIAVFSEAMNHLTITSDNFTLLDGTTPVEGLVSYVGVTATFTPENNLDPSKMYTATINTGVTDLAGNEMADKYSWNFTTGTTIDDISSTITSTTPENEEINVVLDIKVSAVFSEAVNPLTVNNETFTLQKGDVMITGEVFQIGTTVIFEPTEALENETEYTATITNKVADLAGNEMEEDYVWTFTTVPVIANIPPTVFSTMPSDEAIDVALDTDISAEFSKEMNDLTITDLTFLVTDDLFAAVDGAVTYDALTKTATFNPDSDLKTDTEYTVTITTGVEDTTGLALEVDYVWTFTTAAAPTVISTIPIDKAEEVALDTEISAEFSKEMNDLTMTDLTFLVTDDTLAAVDGAVNYDALTKTTTFTPDSDLLLDTEYTVTIKTGVEDTTGLALEVDYVWTFTTAAAPTVISTIPLDEAEDVVPGIDISAEFSKEMNDLTITDLTFLVTDDLLAAVDGVVDYDALTKTATFNPDSALETDTEYTVTITTGVEDTTGIALEIAYVWTFITDAAPTVISTIPLDEATDVALDTEITAEFSEEMNELTITDLVDITFTVTESGMIPVDGTVAYDVLTKTATFTPDSDLLFDTEYTATITTGVENLTGTTMEMDYVWTFTTGVGAVNLGLISKFAIASSGGIDNTGATTINGDVVLDPNFTCNDVPGTHDGTFGLCDGKAPTINGTVITNQYPDTVASAAIKADLNAAYLSIMKGNLPGAIVLGCGTIGSNGDAGALIGCAGNSTLTPGVYISATDSSIGVTGILTLDGQGDQNAEFIFQAPSSTLVTASGAAGFPLSEIRLINGAKASNVWWQVGSSATIGAYSIFQGNILADASITMETGATSCGRLFAGAITTSGAFVFDSNLVSVPGNGCPK